MVHVLCYASLNTERHCPGHLAQSFNNLATDPNLYLSTSPPRSKDNKHAEKNEKPILDFEAVRANYDRYRHWGNHFPDFCILEGYRDTKKNRITETNDHYIAAKRHFELAVPRSAIPPTK